jgi:restriction endonuclease S subunit
MVKLSEVVSFKAEKAKKDKTSYTYIDIGSVDRGNFKAGEAISRGDLPGRAQYSVNIGDILLGTVRPNLEHYLLISPQVHRDDLIVSNGFSIMRCDTTKVLPTYLYSILTLPTTTAYLTERATGTTYPVIDDSIIGAMEIPLPSLERQAEIVEAIDGWASLAQQEMVALKILEKQMMFQVKEMGRGQARVKLGDMLKDVKYPKHPTEYGEESGNYRFHTGAESTKLYTNAPDIDDLVIIVNRTNGSGKCHIFIDSKCSVATQTITFASKIDITTAYLYYYFKSDISILELGYQGACHKNLTSQYINELEIPLPPLTEQQTLQSDFDEIRHKHAKIEEYKAKAQAAIQRLIPGAENKEVNEIINPETSSVSDTSSVSEKPKRKRPQVASSV